MQITYIPAAETNQNVLEKAINNAVSNAIQTTIVNPFKNFCYNLWCGFVEASLPICTAASLIALILALIGIKKARQWVIIPIIVYLFIMMADMMVR